MDRSRRRLVEVFPRFARELESALYGARERVLALRVDGLRIYADCGCDESDCQSFYTAPPPEGAYGDGHRNVELDVPYLLVLDVVDSAIVFVEVIGRPPLD